MELKEFQNIYETIISGYIKEIQETDTLKCLTFRKSRIRKIHIYYERKRREIHTNYMQNPKGLIDRHKIASAFMYAILKARVFKVNRLVPDIPVELLYANEYLALYTAINIVEMFKRANKNFAFHENYTFYFPKTYHSNEHPYETFVYNTCRGMSLIKNIEFFDIFAYSTILFQLERYTDVILEYDQRLKEQDN